MRDTNPYASPGEAKDQDDHTADRFVRFVLRPSFVIACFLLAHFFMSLARWGFVLLTFQRFNPDIFHALDYASYAWPAVFGFALSVIALWCAVRRKWIANPLMAFILLFSAAAFSYDVANERSQMHVTIAHSDYWENGGQEHTYFTWWWYNDGWFR